MAPVLVLSVCGSRSGDVKTPDANRIDGPVDTRRVAVIIASSMSGEAADVARGPGAGGPRADRQGERRKVPRSDLCRAFTVPSAYERDR